MLRSVDACVKQGGTRISVPASVRARYREAYYQMLRRMFDRHRIEVRTWLKRRKQEASRRGLWEPKGQAKELFGPVDRIVDKIVNHAYRAQYRFYDRWFRKMAWELESKRYHDTVDRAKTVIKISREEGLTRVETRELLAKKFEQYSQYELDRVITTEDTRILNVATRVECDEDDTVVGYEWRVNYTGCDVCDDLDGKFFEKDNVPDCPAHPNCQCTTEPVFSWERKAA